MTNALRKKGNYIKEFPSDYTIVDIETTGLSSSNHEIIEISALKVRNDEIINQFSSLIKPQKPIGSFITNLTGITNDMVALAPNITDVLPEFIKFLQDDCIIGHNVNFDINFIYDNLKRHFDKELSNDYTDTMRLSRKHCKFRSNRLSYIAEQFEISTEGHHRALNDCIMTYKIYKKIKEIALEATKTTT